MEYLSNGLILLWMVAALIGFIVLLAKGMLRFGLLTWVVFGWWGVLFLIALGGGFLLWAGIAADGGRTCPHCRERVHSRASRCPNCTAELEPAGQPA